jgi:hypothetical protein
VSFFDASLTAGRDRTRRSEVTTVATEPIVIAPFGEAVADAVTKENWEAVGIEGRFEAAGPRTRCR